MSLCGEGQGCHGGCARAGRLLRVGERERIVGYTSVFRTRHYVAQLNSFSAYLLAVVD